jgi:hypothetical protein
MLQAPEVQEMTWMLLSVCQPTFQLVIRMTFLMNWACALKYDSWEWYAVAQYM